MRASEIPENHCRSSHQDNHRNPFGVLIYVIKQVPHHNTCRSRIESQKGQFNLGHFVVTCINVGQSPQKEQHRPWRNIEDYEWHEPSLCRLKFKRCESDYHLVKGRTRKRPTQVLDFTDLRWGDPFVVPDDLLWEVVDLHVLAPERLQRDHEDAFVHLLLANGLSSCNGCQPDGILIFVFHRFRLLQYTLKIICKILIVQIIQIKHFSYKSDPFSDY